MTHRRFTVADATQGIINCFVGDWRGVRDFYIVADPNTDGGD